MISIDVIIDECADYEKVEIIIKCPKTDGRIARLIEQIEQLEITLAGKKNGSIYSLVANNLYYIESVDNKSYLYDQTDIYESDVKLY